MLARAVAIWATVLGVVLFAVAGAALACTPKPRVFSSLPEAAPPGAAVVVRGENVPSQHPVEIRWNGVRGDLLATATADGHGAFAVPVTVPQAAPGIYTMVFLAGDAGIARMSFEVTSSTTVPVATPRNANTLWSLDTSPASPADDSHLGLQVGMVLLSVGTVALFTGFAVATVRRRRAPLLTGEREG